MKVYWCQTCGREGQNFGDVLGPLLLRTLARVEVEFAPPTEAEVISVGSTLSKVPDGWRGTVLGTGFIQAGMAKDLQRARILAVRGELTRLDAGLKRGVVLGDPGILAPALFARAKQASGSVVIPHYVDHDMRARHPDARYVDICWSPADIVATVSSAQHVFTSSLHGLVLADALGVPHTLEPHPAVKGGLYKFTDYASAMGEIIIPGVERLTPRPEMEAAQARLLTAFGLLSVLS